MKNKNRLQDLKNRISSGSEQQKTISLDSAGALIEMHHILMVEYGWIPIEEFRNLPIPTLWNLLECIKKKQEIQRKQMEKSKRGR